MADAIGIANRLAAEHLEIMTRDPEAIAAEIREAGAIFLGAHTPEAIGDYVGGSNHVLPTARSARFASGLGVLDFMKRSSILRLRSGAACGAWTRLRLRWARPKGSMPTPARSRSGSTGGDVMNLETP